MSRFAAPWDVGVVLQWMCVMVQLHDLAWTDMSLLLMLLMTLPLAARVQKLCFLMLTNIVFGENSGDV